MEIKVLGSNTAGEVILFHSGKIYSENKYSFNKVIYIYNEIYIFKILHYNFI